MALSGETYTVQSGDSLSKIAEKLNITGGWQLLADANADTISDPDLVLVGPGPAAPRLRRRSARLH